MSPTIEKVGRPAKSLGEGPYWEPKSKTLYYVELMEGTVNKYVPSSGEQTQAAVGKHVSFIIPIKGTTNEFVVGIQRQLARITWDGVSEKPSKIEQLLELDDPSDVIQLNDAKVDSFGRLWFGTVAFDRQNHRWLANKASFYSYSKKEGLKTHLDNVTISNGMDWDVKRKKFYYIDSPQRQIFQYDFDGSEGKIYNQQTIFTLDKHDIPGIPDGLTIDADGNLWVAIFDGGRVIKVDPRKPETLLQTVEIPARQVTSVAFGGSNLDELYVTTGNMKMEQSNEPLTGDGNGFIFVVKGLGVTGLPKEEFPL